MKNRIGKYSSSNEAAKAPKMTNLPKTQGKLDMKSPKDIIMGDSYGTTGNKLPIKRG